MPIISTPRDAGPDSAAHARRKGHAAAAWERLAAWATEALRRARETRELVALDDRELRDIGVNRYEVAERLRAPRRALSSGEVDRLVSQARQARSEALFRAATGRARRLWPRLQPEHTGRWRKGWDSNPR